MCVALHRMFELRDLGRGGWGVSFAAFSRFDNHKIALQLCALFRQLKHTLHTDHWQSTSPISIPDTNLHSLADIGLRSWLHLLYRRSPGIHTLVTRTTSSFQNTSR